MIMMTMMAGESAAAFEQRRAGRPSRKIKTLPLPEPFVPGIQVNHKEIHAVWTVPSHQDDDDDDEHQPLIAAKEEVTEAKAEAKTEMATEKEAETDVVHKEKEEADVDADAVTVSSMRVRNVRSLNHPTRRRFP